MENDIETGGTCLSCKVLGFIDDALNGYDQIVFESLASGVTTVGATIVALACTIGVMMRSHMGLDATMGREGANYFFGTLTRLAFAMGFLVSFPIWKSIVVGTLENGIYATVYASIPFEGLDIAPTSFETPLEQTLRQVERSITRPVGDMWDAILNSMSLFSPGKSSALAMMGLGSMAGAAMIVGLVGLFFGELKVWLFMISAFGPLIAFAWIFPETRSAAWSGLKVFMQSGLTVVMATGVCAIVIKSFESFLDGDLGVFREDGELKIDMDQLEYVASFASFGQLAIVMFMVLMMLLLVKLVALFIVFGGIPGVPGMRGR